MSGDTGPSVVYGVHLGNTSASLAISRDGKTEVRVLEELSRECRGAMIDEASFDSSMS